MKKIIALLIVSTFLFSCTNTKQEEIVEETNINENTPLVNEETKVNEETNTGTNIEAIEVTEEENIKSPKDETIKETVEIGSSTGEVTIEEEKILESEVNDLLNEFIDSLDNYDK